MNIGLYIDPHILSCYLTGDSSLDNGMGASGESVAMWCLIDVLIEIGSNIYIIQTKDLNTSKSYGFHLDKRRVRPEIKKENFFKLTDEINSNKYKNLDYIITDITTEMKLSDVEVCLFNIPKNGVICYQYMLNGYCKSWDFIDFKSVILYDFWLDNGIINTFKERFNLVNKNFRIECFYPPFDNIGFNWNPKRKNILMQGDRIWRHWEDGFDSINKSNGGHIDSLFSLIEKLSNKYNDLTVDFVRNKNLIGLSMMGGESFNTAAFKNRTEEMGFRLIFESFYKNNNVRVIHTLPRDKYLKYLSQSLVYIDLYSEGYPNCSKSCL